MSFTNKNFGDKPSLIKPVAIVLVILLVIGGVYYFSGEGSFATKEGQNDSNSELQLRSSGLNPSKSVRDVKDVEEVIAKWVESNPEAIIASVANMQKKAMEEQKKNAQKSIGSKKDQLFNDPNSPEYAPKGYDVTIVEFFDYNCGYCKKAHATISKLVQEDKKVRLVHKHFPILGQSSREMSEVALAVYIAQPNSYKKFHDALMSSNKRGKQGALDVVKSVGINVGKVKKVLNSEKSKIDALLQSNLTLGSSIGVNGTPGFVLGEELIPGAFDLKTFKEKVDVVRATK